MIHVKTGYNTANCTLVPSPLKYAIRQNAFMSDHKQPLKRPVRHRFEALLAHSVFAVLKLLPAAWASALGGWLGRVAGPVSSAHHTAAKNLSDALPEVPAGERAQILSASWDNLGRTMTEYTTLQRMHENNDNIELTGAEKVAALARKGKPVIFVSAHLGNWEAVPIALAINAKPPVIVYRAANNPLVDKIIANVRRPYTAGMAPKGAAGGRQVMKALARGEHVLMLVDQKSNTGMEIPFFGRGAFTGTAVARMAARYRCPVFPVRCERVQGTKFKIVIEEPFEFSDESEEGVRAALTKINERLEEWIKRTPGQWLWMHKRWPT